MTIAGAAVAMREEALREHEVRSFARVMATYSNRRPSSISGVEPARLISVLIK
jgi:hypothetical protein